MSDLAGKLALVAGGYGYIGTMSLFGDKFARLAARRASKVTALEPVAAPQQVEVHARASTIDRLAA